MAGKEQLYCRPSAREFASPWYQMAPLMVVRSSGTTFPFQSTESVKFAGQSHGSDPLHLSIASGEDQC